MKTINHENDIQPYKNHENVWKLSGRNFEWVKTLSASGIDLTK